MPEVDRISISVDAPLRRELDALVRRGGFTNRSEFFRDLIRSRLVEEQWEQNREAVGTITLLYDHHSRRIGEKLTGIQHRHHRQVLATTHVHLDPRVCLEVIIIRGRASAIREMSNRLGEQKGVLHCSLSLSSTGRELATGAPE